MRDSRSEVEEGIYSIEERLDVLKGDLARIEAKLDRLMPDDELREHFILLAGEVGRYEGLLNSIEAKLDRLLPIADVLEQVGEGGFSLPKLLGALAGRGG